MVYAQKRCQFSAFVALVLICCSNSVFAQYPATYYGNNFNYRYYPRDVLQRSYYRAALQNARIARLENGITIGRLRFQMHEEYRERQYIKRLRSHPPRPMQQVVEANTVVTYNGNTYASYAELSQTAEWKEERIKRELTDRREILYRKLKLEQAKGKLISDEEINETLDDAQRAIEPLIRDGVYDGTIQ